MGVALAVAMHRPCMFACRYPLAQPGPADPASFGVGALVRRLLTEQAWSQRHRYAMAFTLMGIGVYLAIIMFLNVWGVIWPNQKRALGIVEADDATKARSARIAGMASRINTLLSLPMLTAMAMYQSMFG